jgi:hypothetical protein
VFITLNQMQPEVDEVHIENEEILLKVEVSEGQLVIHLFTETNVRM